MSVRNSKINTQITLRAFRVAGESPARREAEGAAAIETVPEDSRLTELDIAPGHVVLDVEDERDVRLLDAVLASTRRDRQVFEETVEAMTPESVPSQPAVEQMRRNAEARHRFLAEHGALASEEVAEIAGSRARNRAARAYRLQRGQKVFAVRYHGRTLFPAFQFEADGEVRLAIPQVLRALHDRGLSGWEMALWFVAGSSFLGGRRPLDLLDEDPELVIEHAARPTPY